MFTNSFPSKVDLKLYYNTYKYSDSFLYLDRGIEWEVSEEMASAPVDGKVAGYLNTLANKVVKFLLTSKGSDTINSEYGGNVSSSTWIHEGYRGRYEQELSQDIQRCISFIKSTETPGPDNERLRAVILDKLEYLPKHRPLDVHIFLRILTTKNNVALLSFNTKYQPNQN